MAVLSIALGILESRADVPDGRELLRRVRDSRLAIQRGNVRLRTSYHDHSTHRLHVRDWTIFFDGDRLRGDLRLGDAEAGSGQADHRVVEISCYGCYPHNAHIFYSTEPAPNPGGEMALVISDANEKPPTLHFVPEPRWFATIPTGSMDTVHHSPLGFLSAADDVAVDVDETEVRGEMCWSVTWDGPVAPLGRPRYTLWIAPHRGHALLRAQSRWVTGGCEFVAVVESIGEEHVKSGIWFPVSWRYERREGGTVTFTENADVTVVSLNEPLDETVFSLRGIDVLKKGSPVAWHMDHDRPFPEGSLLWDGERIVAAEPGVAERLSEVAGRSRRPVLIGLNVILISGAIAAILLRQYLRGRAPPPSGTSTKPA